MSDDDSNEEEKKAQPKAVAHVPLDEAGEKKLQEIEQKTFELRKELQAAKEQCIEEIFSKVKHQVNETKQAFIEKELLEKKL